jgi:hypothetical protein
VEKAKSLSVEELSLHEFLLDQILFLQELLDLSLIPRIIDELLGRELPPPPALPPSTVVIPPSVEGRVAKECSVAVCAHGPLSVGALVMVVREPTEDHVLLPSSQVLEIWPSSIQVTVTKHI